MLIRRELPIVKVAIRIGIVVAILVGAGLVWYFNPVKRAQRVRRTTVPLQVRKPVTIPKDLFDDARLFAGWEVIPEDALRIVGTFGRTDPFASLAPPRTATSTATTTPQR